MYFLIILHILSIKQIMDIFKYYYYFIVDYVLFLISSQMVYLQQIVPV